MPVFNISTAPKEIPSASLELYDAGNTPYIDFHGSADTRNYDARIIYRATDNRVFFNFNENVTGGVTIQKGPLEVSDGNIYVGTTSTTVERDVYVRAQAGEILLYSTGTTNGRRGLWVQPHGTDTGGKSIIYVDTNNAVKYASGNVIGKLTIDSGGLTITAGGASITGNSTVTGTLNITSAATVGDALRTGAITGTSTMNISGNTTIGGTLRAANTITVTTGGITVTAGNIVAHAGYLYAENNHVYAGATSNTAERDVYARSGAGVIRMYSEGNTNGTRGIYADAHGTGSAQYLIWADTNNTVYLNAGARVSSANNNATRLRNIQVQNSSGTATSTNYIIMKRG